MCIKKNGELRVNECELCDILFKLSREDKYMKLVSLGRINGVSQQKVPLQEFLYYDGFFEKFKDTMQ